MNKIVILSIYLGHNICLTFSDGIVIVNFPRSANAVVGQNLSLTCQVEIETESIVTFEWTQNLRPFSDRNIAVTSGTKKSVLFIENLTLKNSAVYSCKATADSLTGAGSSYDMADVRIKVKGKGSEVLGNKRNSVYQDS